MSDQEIKRAGCFEGDKTDIESLCSRPECRFEYACIWKKRRVNLPSNLGSDGNKTEAMRAIGVK